VSTPIRVSFGLVNAYLLQGAGAPFARVMRFARCEPDVVVDDVFSLRGFGLAGRVVHTPGHTAGSISVVLDNGDAVVGDLCQNGWGFGMGLGPIVPPLADQPEALPSSWERLLREGACRFFPGHGQPFSAEELQVVAERKRRGA
jgi:hydroxyacylglutathione hydrolase